MTRITSPPFTSDDMVTKTSEWSYSHPLEHGLASSSSLSSSGLVMEAVETKDSGRDEGKKYSWQRLFKSSASGILYSLPPSCTTNLHLSKPVMFDATLSSASTKVEEGLPLPAAVLMLSTHLSRDRSVFIIIGTSRRAWLR